LENGVALARCAIWTGGTAAYRGLPTAYLGHLAAADREALRALLGGVAESLDEAHAGRGPHWLLGPIDGSTWYRYRVVVDSGDEPPFPMEPQNPGWWADGFGAAGFEIVERYWSAAADIEPGPIDTAAFPHGIEVRDLRLADLGRELDTIYELAGDAFAANPLYTPISREAFRRMYEPIAAHLDPEFCLIAETPDAEAVGVMFSAPTADGRLVLKTLGIAGRLRGQGLGSGLLREVGRRAARRDLTRLIFALMHESNPSSHMAGKVAAPCRRYALFGRVIGR
jgi:ribosomal protein S18 acetylase RimI-like enzyme